MHKTEDATAIIEWAPFRLKDGTDREALIAAARAIEQRFLAAQPGFLRRELAALPDGRYADIVLWADRQSADAAMAKVETSADCAAYFAMMDFGPGSEMPTMAERIAL